MSDLVRPCVRLADGNEIPQIGFGTWQVPPQRTARVVGDALMAGYRHVDTAMIYRNEAGVGRAVRESGLPRQDVFVATKLWNGDQGQTETFEAFDLSLAELGMDWVDLYLIHWPVPSKDMFVEAWRAMIDIQTSGRARSIGVCNFRPEDIDRLAQETGVLPAVNQVELHPSFQQAELRALHAELGIVTAAWSPLGRGQDLGLEAIDRIADDHGVTPAQVIVRWHLQLGNVVVPKSCDPYRIAENIDVFHFELTEADMAAIEALEAGNRMGGDPAEVA